MNFFFSGGDSPFFFLEQLREFSFFPRLWQGEQEFGRSILPFLWIEYPFRLVTFILSRAGFSWFWIDKFWWGLVFILAVFGAYRLGKYFGLSKKFSLISSLIYATNTYVLLLFDGGQLGVALAYGLVPWAVRSVLLYISKKEKKENFTQTIKTGLLLSVLVFLDIRIAYVAGILLLPLVVITILKRMFVLPPLWFLIPCIVIGINCYWLLPTVMYKESLHAAVLQATNTGSDLSFFSVADFPHSLSLLHPNYPENLFGRVYFFKPEFLILPILAFSFLLSGSPSPYIVGIGIIALLGAFLGKGVHGPFGTVYEFLYRTVPGFYLFRDPTKWYVLPAVAYSILVPLSLNSIAEIVFRTGKNRRMWGILLFFCLFWIVTLRFVFLGKVTGNISPPVMTKDYEMLKNILIQDNTLGRTLWIPSVERLGYASLIHPALSSTQLLGESSPSGITRSIENNELILKAISAGASYIIVPEDIEHRMFLDDYRFKSELRSDLIAQLDSVPSLKKMTNFTDLAVYKMPDHRPFFMIDGEKLSATPDKIDSWKIAIPERNAEKTLQSLMAYDPHWALEKNGNVVYPTRTQEGFMNFQAGSSGENETYILRYLPTYMAKIGTLVSGVTLFSILIMIILRNRKHRSI